MSVSSGWDLLRSLRQHRARLRNETKYRKFNLDQEPTSISEINRQNNLHLLENGLREIMRRKDLDTLLDGHLDEAAGEQARTHVESICALMERGLDNFNSGAVQRIGHPTDNYDRLRALLDELSKTAWEFVMVSGDTRKLFEPMTLEQDKEEVEKFNDFFNSLTRFSIMDVCPAAPAREVSPELEKPNVSHAQDHPVTVFDGLDTLLSRLNDPKICQKHHVLLQLPQSNAASRKEYQESQLKLFLSICGAETPPIWLESQLETLLSTDIDEEDLCPVGPELCSHIRDTEEIGDKLYLAATAENIHIRLTGLSDFDENSDPMPCPIKKPVVTLKSLIKMGAFNQWVWGYNGPRFSEQDKEELAATLISSLPLSLDRDSSRVIKCWDSDSIYFLGESKDECMQSCPYALCTHMPVNGPKATGSGATQRSDPSLERVDFQLMAKLLLAIGGWSVGDGAIAASEIQREIYRDLRRRNYLEAVHNCLVFRQRCQRDMKIRGFKGKITTVANAASGIVSEIIGKIRSTSQQKRQLVDEEDHTYQITSEDDQSGIWGGSRTRSPQPPPQKGHPGHSDSYSSNRTAQSRGKRVKFIVNDSENEQPLATTTRLPPEATNHSLTDRYPRLHCGRKRSNDRNGGRFVNSTPRTPSPAAPSREFSRHSESPGPEQAPSPTPSYLYTSGHFSQGSPSPPASRREFKIAIICALPLEANAVCSLLDEDWDSERDRYGIAPGDTNTYSTGLIGNHSVVIAHMPHMGKCNAAIVAANCRKSFPEITLGLIVGICGAAPFKNGHKSMEILLGDVVISTGVIQYDFGSQYPHGFARKTGVLDNLGRHGMKVNSLLAKLQSSHVKRKLQNKTCEYLSTFAKVGDTISYPGAGEDKLFDSSYRHKHPGLSDCRICAACQKKDDPVCLEAIDLACEKLGCEIANLVPRKRLTEAMKDTHQNPHSLKPEIHFGLVASGDTVMKSAEDRDEIASREGIIAFEMEAAGVWENFPCLVIKGVCDYADSHKSKRWQEYAAATAAACTKAFLDHWAVVDVS
ncbi:hypothetical protein TWF481_010297 [Arthrobotrys musiformis]|uniref:Nucleoside phosphorylase domain-containing protein n=1 Tax=Arthrobotrys musiformis TaxID=47236 RepID=A0AAV9W2J1_9PEZI